MGVRTLFSKVLFDVDWFVVLCDCHTSGARKESDKGAVKIHFETKTNLWNLLVVLY